MSSREEVARAIAFFETADDVGLLHNLIHEIADQVRILVRNMVATGGEEGIPPPAELSSARDAASQDEAVRTLRATKDFALLQALARAIGRRIEAIEIVASAEFPEGTRVSVPERPVFPPPEKRVQGTVVSAGMVLAVRLDSGESWTGPASLARKAPGAAPHATGAR